MAIKRALNIFLYVFLSGILFVSIDFAPTIKAETAVPSDSISRSKYQWTRVLPLTLFAVSTPGLDQTMYDWRSIHFGSFRTYVDDYSSLIPVATSWGLYFGGVKPKYSNSAGEMFLLQGSAVLLSTAITHAGKRGFGRMRPDQNNYKSFPSGHTSFSFVCATLLVEEYGERYPWLAAFSYTSASLTATARILNNRHWVSDLAGGAVVGILSAKLTYALAFVLTGKPYNLYSYRDEPLKGYSVSFRRGWTLFSENIFNHFGAAVRVPFYKEWGAVAQMAWSAMGSEKSDFSRFIGGGVSYRRELPLNGFFFDGALSLNHYSHFGESRDGWNLRPELGLIFRTGNVSLLKGYTAFSSAPWKNNQPGTWEFGMAVEWGW